VVNARGLISNLEARAAHAKVHLVHVDLTGKGLFLCDLEAGIFVFIDWKQNFDFFGSAFSDRLGEA
jgi:hypothetical protein